MWRLSIWQAASCLMNEAYVLQFGVTFFRHFLLLWWTCISHLLNNSLIFISLCFLMSFGVFSAMKLKENFERK